MKSSQFVAPLLLCAVMFAAPAYAEGDAAAGQKIYAQCRACHSLEAGKNGLGPSLKGVVGRKAASVESFKTYSPAMQKSGVTWSEDNIKKYLADPKGFVRERHRLHQAGIGEVTRRARQPSRRSAA